MRSYIAFTKKELTEHFRTFKVLILIAVFAIIGLMSPLTAKFLPRIIESFISEGIQIELPTPSAMDSWSQFFKNVTQTGLLVIAIVFSGMLSREYEKGTLINMVTKGLSRKTVIFSKFTAATMLWTASYWLCFAITYGYTRYFWKTENVPQLSYSSVFLYLFGILIVSLLLLGGVISKSNYGVLLLTGCSVIILFLVDLLPKSDSYNPLKLASQNISLLSGILSPGEFVGPIIASLSLTSVAVALSILFFDRKQI